MVKTCRQKTLCKDSDAVSLFAHTSTRPSKRMHQPAKVCAAMGGKSRQVLVCFVWFAFTRCWLGCPLPEEFLSLR